MFPRIGIDWEVDPVTGKGEMDPGAAAEYAEDLDIDSFWVADNLARENKPILDSMMILAAASATTERIEVGLGVLQLALRPAAWAAKQIATLQMLSGDRTILGVGAGGTFPEEWATVGLSTKDRGRRTDAVLEVLPSLLAGLPTKLPESSSPVTLLPAVHMPRIWVGGGSTAAMRRAAKYGDGWLPAIITPEDLRSKGLQLAEMASEYGRPAPSLGVQLHADLRAERDGPRHQELSSWMSTRFRLPLSDAERLVLSGSAAEISERLAAYGDAGAEVIVVGPLGGGWQAQCDVLADARRFIAE